MSDTISELRADLERLETERHGIEGEIRNARLAEDIGALRQLRERNLILPDEIHIARVRLTKAEIAERKSELEALEEQRTPALEKIEKTKASLEEVKNSFFEHEQAFAVASGEHQSLMNGIASKRAELKEAESRLENLTSDKESVQNTKSNHGHLEMSEAEAAFQGFQAIYRKGAE